LGSANYFNHRNFDCVWISRLVCLLYLERLPC